MLDLHVQTPAMLKSAVNQFFLATGRRPSAKFARVGAGPSSTEFWNAARLLAESGLTEELVTHDCDVAIVLIDVLSNASAAILRQTTESLKGLTPFIFAVGDEPVDVREGDQSWPHFVDKTKFPDGFLMLTAFALADLGILREG